MSLERLPLIHLDRVYHIGTLNSAHKGRTHNAHSLEGGCLSVSCCPMAWRRIARLGGGHLFELHRPEGAFLDLHAALDNERIRQEATEWARDEGLIEMRQMWRAWYFDDELGDWCWSIHASHEDAQNEALDAAMSDVPADIGAPEGHEGVEVIRVVAGTPLFNERVGWSRSDDRDVADMAVMLWAQSALPSRHGIQLDGVWWRENYDPARLSAPRGGLFPERMSDWKRARLDWSAAPGDEEDVPPVVWIAKDVVGSMQKDGSVVIRGVRWIRPYPEWVTRHGGPVYCSCCRAGGEKVPALVPTDRQSVSHRRAFAACEAHLPLMSEKLAKHNEVERRERLYQTEAELRLFRR